jgi:hypothetical protein
MKTKQFGTFAIVAGLLSVLCATLPAQVPQIINYQGRVLVGPTNFNGAGQFKFALVNNTGTTTYWSNDGTSNSGSEPTNAVSLTVSNGLYSVLLGDTTIINMTVSIPASAFNNSDVRLRVWFNDGTTGSQLLSPDQRIASVGYAVIAGTVPDGAITMAKLASGAVGSGQIANGGVGNAQIANGAVTSAKIDNTSVQQRVTGTAPSGSFITGVNADGTVSTAAGGSGTITGVTASTGLTGGGSSGNVTLSIANGGVTGLQIANGAVGSAQIASSAVGSAQIANGAVTSTQIDSTTVQRRVTGTAPSGSFLTGINQDGTVATGLGSSGPFLLNGTTAYYNGGMVGIGTSTPPATFPSKLTIQTPSGSGYGLEHTNGTVRLATFVGGSSMTAGWLGTITSHPLAFFVGNGGASMAINTDSTIDIGTPVPSTLNGRLTVNAAASDTFPFYVKDSGGSDLFRLIVGSPPSLQMFGNASKSSGGTSWGIISDRRVKQDVRAFEPGLNEIVRLRPVRFHYRDDIKRGLSSGQEEVGFIAQEVREVIADAVVEGADGYLTLKADPIHWAGINAIQELNRKLEEQHAENAELEQRLEKLEQRINQKNGGAK